MILDLRFFCYFHFPDYRTYIRLALNFHNLAMEDIIKTIKNDKNVIENAKKIKFPSLFSSTCKGKSEV